MPDRIVLITAAAPWLKRLYFVCAMLAAATILATPTAPGWQAGALLALAVFLLLERRCSESRHPAGRLTVRLDGTVNLRAGEREITGTLDDGGWASSWFCVVRWTPLESGKRQHSLVCASLNRKSDYRRLLVWLRLGASPARGAHAQ